MQIRARLALQFLMIVTGILLAVFFIIKFQFKRNLEEEHYKRLRLNAYMISDRVLANKMDEEELNIENPFKATDALAGSYPDNITIYNLGARVIYMYQPGAVFIKPGALEEALAAGEIRFVEGRRIALGIIFMNNEGIRFFVVVESYVNQVYMENLTQILSVVFLISIILIAVGGWFFARQALAPVSRIMNQVDALLPTDMSQRLEPSNQYDELSRLVITFNKLLDRIQQVFRVQKTFLSNVSHELKNPLNVIISQVEVTLAKDRSKEEYIQTLKSVHTDVRELNEIGDKLMQMARINADDATIRFHPVRIDEIIWEAKENLLKNHPDYKITFEVVNLPEEESKLMVNGNESLLKTALINLMDNGCKFSPDKNVKVKLAFPAEETISIEISDKGPGIPEEEIPVVFNAFYRSPRTSAVKGSGIGLSLVESILKLHRITLEVNSETGKGTTFIMKIPVEKPVSLPVSIEG